jgi:hypothetical protein
MGKIIALSWVCGHTLNYCYNIPCQFLVSSTKYWEEREGRKEEGGRGEGGKRVRG